MIKREDYIIDFDRVNQLTSTIYDDPNDDSNPFVKGKFAYSITRKLLNGYLEKFMSASDRKLSDGEMKHIVMTLEYNGILKHKSVLRDEKISSLLE